MKVPVAQMLNGPERHVTAEGYKFLM